MHTDDLFETGYARTGRLLDVDECRELRGLYGEPENFRSRIVMSRFRFGRGEYQYFRNPLPPAVQRLREAVYRELAPAANRWAAALGLATKFPSELDAFLAQCHAAGQVRPTPLLLQYGPGDFNCLHQDLYGPVFFPFQLIVGLSEPDVEYSGGELLLVEQQPRAQSKGMALRIGQGEGVVITTRYRPVQGTRGHYRAAMRHGVSPVAGGERYTLGVIFHDAE
jgi:hypothetical protein